MHNIEYADKCDLDNYLDKRRLPRLSGLSGLGGLSGIVTGSGGGGGGGGGGTVPSSVPNMRFWWDVSLGQAYEHYDKTGHNPPHDGEFLGYLASQVNPSGSDLEHVLQDDEGNHHTPIYRVAAINGLDAIEGPIQSDNSRNAVMRSNQDLTLSNSSDIMIYFVAKSTMNFTSDNNSRIMFTFGNPSGGNNTGFWTGFNNKKFTVACHGGGGPRREFGVGNNNWHIWTYKLTHGVNMLSGNGMRLYIDGTELTSGTDFNSGNDTTPNPSAGQRLYWFNYTQGGDWTSLWYGQCSCFLMYNDTHNDTVRNGIEAYLRSRFGL